MACVTGARAGLGRRAAIALASAGAKVVGVARRRDALLGLQQEIGEALCVVDHDVANRDLLADLAQKVAQPFGLPDIIVHAAGINTRQSADDVTDSQLTKSNIEGGMTAIEGKAPGNLEKIGRTSKYIDILELAKETKSGKGPYFMDSSSAAAECVTLTAVGSYVVHTFPMGQGNVVGNPIVPVIKIKANPRTVRTMSEHVDVSGILRRDMSIDQAGDSLIDMI